MAMARGMLSRVKCIVDDSVWSFFVLFIFPLYSDYAPFVILLRVLFHRYTINSQERIGLKKLGEN
ncbi:hypothetical protein K440DRAFT_617859 [Wilcoxina mikolae CBS 423.85]|nr:hypothetical protein K440DRAFT_617859 [Wilcoxina mikolae CBS 423.85]